MFSFYSAVFSFSRRAGMLGALGALTCVAGGGTVVLAQNAAPPEKVKVKAGAPELGQSVLRLTPDPANLALDDCSGSTAPLNQYAIDSVMATNISLLNGNSDIATRVLNNYSWKLSGSGITLLTPEKTSGTPDSSGNWDIRPYHLIEIDQGSYWVAGFFFDVHTDSSNPIGGSGTDSTGWKFPSSNGDFGKQTFTHTVEGNAFPAQVALFYPSGGFQHPAGGPPGYYVNSGIDVHTIETPNWFYYYSKAWTPPVPIVYWDRTYSEYIYGHPHIHVGSPAHGMSYGKRPLFEMRSGVMTWVGSYQCFGIDAFARVITHEAKHKEMYEDYHQSIEDAENDDIPDDETGEDGKMLDPDADPDNDGIPSGIEESLGLLPLNTDSTGFIAGGGYDGDSEAIARWAENQIGISPNRDADWANDGLNYGRNPGACPQKRIQKFQRDGVTPLE